MNEAAIFYTFYTLTAPLLFDQGLCIFLFPCFVATTAWKKIKTGLHYRMKCVTVIMNKKVGNPLCPCVCGCSTGHNKPHQAEEDLNNCRWSLLPMIVPSPQSLIITSSFSLVCVHCWPSAEQEQRSCCWSNECFGCLVTQKQWEKGKQSRTDPLIQVPIISPGAER